MQMKIFPNDPAFPPLLREIPDPPIMLFTKGKMPTYDRPLIAIVGTRVPSSYGIDMARYFSQTLSEAGCVIVSGFARGIDSIAHEAAIEVSGGETIAILGCGLNHVYPPENKKLAEKVLENGTFFSEFPDDMGPKPWNFPSRNRIIAGMCQATVVIEAPRKSGALITSDLATNYNRLVFAVPGNIGNKGSFGTNELIQKGAQITTSPEDILEELHFQPSLKEKTDRLRLTEDEQIVLQLLEKESQHIDALVSKSDLPVEKIMSLLTIMELKKLILTEGNVYRLKKSS